MSLESKRILLSAEANGVELRDSAATSALSLKHISVKREVEAPPFVGNAMNGLARSGARTI
ncbi:MAG: hypothetical protein ACFCUR_04490 [Rhodomicrobiaceae bacterium]